MASKMRIPNDIKVYDHPLATIWFDKDGILHKVSKNKPRTQESVQDLYSYIRKLTKGKKVCGMLEVSKEGVSDVNSREYLKKEIPNTFAAVALMASTPLGQLTGTLMSVLTPTHIPTKIFKHEDDAKKWLTDYVHLC
jgi:hypothetical protein